MDVKLSSREIDKPLTFVAGGVPGLLFADFISSLPAEVVSRDLLLGRVFGPDGDFLPGWTTFRGQYRLIVRGTTNISHRTCESCGQLLYFAMGRRHLFPAPPKDAAVFQSDLAGLIVHEHLFPLLDVASWRGRIHVDRLQVAKTSLDGLGAC